MCRSYFSVLLVYSVCHSEWYQSNGLNYKRLKNCGKKRHGEKWKILEDNNLNEHGLVKGPFAQAIFVAQLNAIFVALKLETAATSSRF